MANNEAARNLEPLENVRRIKLIKRTINSCFLVICILFIVVISLCANNLVIYKSYRDSHQQFEEAFLKIESITVDKRDLYAENENIKKENINLEEKYSTIKQQNDEVKKALDEIKAKNEQLLNENKELKEDNIALQNSLKMAASVGIKPQSYTTFSGISSRGEFQRGTYVGKFVGTAYTPSKAECGNNKGITNSGKPIIPGVSIAIDNKYWPFGTVFYIKGLGYAVAMDTGSAIKGKYRFDFAVFDKKFAQTLGNQSWDVYLVKMGNGSVEEIKF